MSLDTFLKRGSAIDLGLPFRPWLSVPSGTLTVGERLSLRWLEAATAVAIPPGSLTWTIKTEGGAPIEDAKVWLSSADIYTPGNLIPDSIQRTDENGEVDYVLDVDTVYYGWRFHPKYTWHDPWQFKFNSALDRWEYWDGDEYVEWNP